MQSLEVGKSRPWVVLLVTLTVQLALQSYFFPLHEVFTAVPLYYIDSAFHQFQMESARVLCAQHRLVGYDPFFAAGYLGGVTFNASAKLPALMSCAVGAASAVAPIYKIFSFTMGLLAPGALVLAAVLLRFDARATWIVAAFALLTWWTGPMRWYHTAGLVSYVAVAYGCLPFAAGASLTCRAPSVGRVLALAGCAALGTLIHPLFVVAVTLVCIPLLLGDLHGHGGLKRIAWVALIAAGGVLAVNGIWLFASLSGPNFVTVGQPYQRLVDPLLALHELLGVAATASGGSRLYVVLSAGAIAALLLSAGTLRRLVVMLTAAAALVMLWASIGGLHPGIAALQPNRFSALAWLVLSLPAALGASALASACHERRGTARLFAAGGLMLITAGSLYFVRETGLEVFSQRTARYGVLRPEVKGEGALSPRLVKWVNANTDASARVYFETSLARIHDQAHMAGTYALQTQREFIGGPYPFTDFASAWDGVAFGRSLDSMTSSEVVRYLDLYNVKWMLCHSERCRVAMGALPGTAQVATIGPVTAFARQVVASYFLSGAGVVRARCLNRVDIEVQSVGEVVLKYHWVQGLITAPPMPLEKRFVPDDPRPFIAIARPAPNFSLGVGEPAPECKSVTQQALADGYQRGTTPQPGVSLNRAGE